MNSNCLRTMLHKCFNIMPMQLKSYHLSGAVDSTGACQAGVLGVNLQFANKFIERQRPPTAAG